VIKIERVSHRVHAGPSIPERDLLTKDLSACLSIVVGDDASVGGFAVVQMAGLVLHTCIAADPVFVNHRMYLTKGKVSYI
jgi:hypothetical protein